jgi:beta-1,4-mannosyl-glycoprotein beta-1,4-N-acetylglucosaminyltransferase
MACAFDSKETHDFFISTSKRKYKVIVLIIASREPSYDQFTQCWREYMNSRDDIYSFFIYSDITIKYDFVVTRDTITHKSAECNVPGIFLKTTASMKLCERLFDYDYLLRTNLSSFFHFPRMLSYLDKQSRTGFVASQFYNLPNHPNKRSQQIAVNEFFGKELNDRFVFLHGAAFILSQDIVAKYVSIVSSDTASCNKVLGLPDDVAISMLLCKCIEPVMNEETHHYFMPREYKNLCDVKVQCSQLLVPADVPEHIFHFRNKHDDSDTDNSVEHRLVDIENYRRQVAHFYRANTPPKKIIDCFTFYNELEMLFYRLTVLNDVVDTFVLVESTRTHSGAEKPLFYEENKHRFANFASKIIHIVVDDLLVPNILSGEQWSNEKYQRDCIDRGIRELVLSDSDLIVITDLDEIPDPSMLTAVKTSPNSFGISYAALQQDFYYYNLNSKMNEIWIHPKIITFAEYVKVGRKPSSIRLGNAPAIVESGGWHLSYFGSAEFVQNKLFQFAHQEFNVPEITDIENLDNKMKSGQDILGREHVQITRIPIRDNTYLPPRYEEFLSNFIVA